jgi:hypothetical protein
MSPSRHAHTTPWRHLIRACDYMPSES